MSKPPVPTLRPAMVPGSPLDPGGMTYFLMTISSDRLERQESLPACCREPSPSQMPRIQRANPGGSQTEQRAPDWRRFTAPARPSSYRGDGLTASERPPYAGGTSDRAAAAYLPPRRFEELENAIGGDGGPVRTIAELVPQLVASLLELEDSANFRQLFGRDGYEPHGAVFHCRLIALEEGMARQSLPRPQAPKRLGAFLRWTSGRRGVHRIT